MAEQSVRLTGSQLAQLANHERQRLADINSRIASVRGLRNEMQAARDALGEIAASEKGSEMLVNLGAGVYVKAGIIDNAKAVAPIAGNAFTEKGAKELIKGMEKKIANLDRSIEGIAREQEKAIIRINQLEQVIEAGMRAMHQQRSQK